MGNNLEVWEMIQSFVTHFRALWIYSEHLYTILSFVNHSELCAYFQNFVKLFEVIQEHQPVSCIVNLFRNLFRSLYNNSKVCRAIQGFVQQVMLWTTIQSFIQLF